MKDNFDVPDFGIDFSKVKRIILVQKSADPRKDIDGYASTVFNRTVEYGQTILDGFEKGTKIWRAAIYFLTRQDELSRYLVILSGRSITTFASEKSKHSL